MKRLLYANMVSLFLLLCTIFFITTIVNAQDDKVLEEIRNEFDKVYGKKIEEELKKDQSKFESMKSEAEGIGKIKNEDAKKKAMDNYTRAHKEHYGKMVKNAGVDINSVIAHLSKQFPQYRFTSTDDYSIIAEKETKDLGLQRQSINNTSTDLLGTTFHAITTPPAYYAHNVLPVSALYLSTFFGSLKTLGVQPLIFTQTKSVNCALASGGYVNIGSMYALSSTSGVVAGGCSSSGNLSSSSVLPTAAQSIYLRLSGTVEVSGYAVGVIGTSATDASASFNSYISSEGSMASNYLSKSAFAPFLWVASFNDIKSFNHYIDLTSKKGKTLNVAGSSRSFSISGLCCATNSSSKINFTTAELVVQ